jgi:hypothetical protein
MRLAQLAILGACGAFFAAPAFAQSGAQQNGTHQSSPQAMNPPSGSADAGASTPGHDSGQWSSNPRQALRQDLQKAGFTDIRIEPQVFIVHARNSEGHPVLMRIGPDSMEAVTALGAPGAHSSQGSGMQAGNGSNSDSGTTYQ